MRSSLGKSVVVVSALALLAACNTGGERGELQVPASIEQEVNEGGPNPAARTVVVTNSGTCELALSGTVATSDGRPWVSFAPTNANVAPGASVNLSLSFDVVSTALTPGNYVGTLTLTGTCTATGQPARGSPKAVALNLRVTAIGAAIAVDTTSVGVDTNPLLDQWRGIADNSLYTGRTGHTAVWTGREMWIFGGQTAASVTQGVGGKYDPLVDSWANMPTASAPSSRTGHTAVWTGTQMIVWGGRTGAADSTAVDTGGRLAGSWAATTTTNAPSARWAHTAVWTGTEMIVYGGIDTTGARLNTGARYNPTTNVWTALSTTNAPGARAHHVAVWTGRDMLVWGGESAAGVYRTTGARYNPATATWTAMAAGGPARNYAVTAWTGSHWIVYSGEGIHPMNGSTVVLPDGAAYSPAEDAWVDVPSDVQARGDFAASAWTGRELLLWGGGTPGRRLNPFTGTWAALATQGEPSARSGTSGVWIGNAFVVYGGDGHATGGLYR